MVCYLLLLLTFCFAKNIHGMAPEQNGSYGDKHAERANDQSLQESLRAQFRQALSDNLSYERVKAIVDQMTNPFTIDDVIITASVADPQIMLMILPRTVNANEDASLWRYVLEIVIMHGWIDVLTYLVDGQYVKLYAGRTCKNAAHYAARCSSLSMMQQVVSLSRGAYIARCGWRGFTPLHEAVQFGKLEIVKFLVEELGVDINPVFLQNGKTPLHYAAGDGHNEICRYLVSKGADQSLRDKKGKAPFDIVG